MRKLNAPVKMPHEVIVRRLPVVLREQLGRGGNLTRNSVVRNSKRFVSTAEVVTVRRSKCETLDFENCERLLVQIPANVFKVACQCLTSAYKNISRFE